MIDSLFSKDFWSIRVVCISLILSLTKDRRSKTRSDGSSRGQNPVGVGIEIGNSQVLIMNHDDLRLFLVSKISLKLNRISKYKRRLSTARQKNLDFSCVLERVHAPRTDCQENILDNCYLAVWYWTRSKLQTMQKSKKIEANGSSLRHGETTFGLNQSKKGNNNVFKNY